MADVKVGMSTKECHRMKHRMLLFLICLTLFPELTIADDAGYGYPISGSYEATILGTPANLVPLFPLPMRTRKLLLTGISQREKKPIFFYDTGLRCTFAYQKQKAPLVFVIGGAGASDRSDKSMVLMKALYQAGFHVISLPSPTNANFIISASQSSIPGDMVEDASDLYAVMESAWQQVRDGIEVTSFYLCGYSLGGSQAAFVAKLDEERRTFNFCKVLMINPPVSQYNSVLRIEELVTQIPGGSGKQGRFINKMLSKFSEFYRYGNFVAINDDFLYAIYNQQLFSRAETAGLIGISFRLNLAGMIFASDVMTNSGYVVPKNRVLKSTDPLFDYFLVSSHLSFLNYFDEYLFPHVQKQFPKLTKQAFIDSQSLVSIEGYLKSSAKFAVMTNENDFILTRAERDYLKQLFGDQTKIFPSGGHLGNLAYKENLAYLVKFFHDAEVSQ
jgi:pimeloyl-ACP methyl ester carboxylesterase